MLNPRLKRWLAKAGLLAASIALALLIGEVVARVAYPMRRSLSWYHYDPRYGFRHRESYDAMTNDWGEGKLWRFHTNSHGFRWPEWSLEAPKDARRVLVMGDSFTFGDALSEDEAFPGVAGARAGKAWQVVNAGTSAWGPAHALAYLETEGAPIEAGCLVYALFEGNDVIDVMTHGGYELKDGAIVSRVETRKAEVTRMSRVRDVLRGSLYDFLLEHSQLFNIVRAGGLNTVAKQGAAGDPYHDTSREAYDRGVELTLAVLDRLAALAKKRFGGFAIVLLPMRAQLTGGGKGDKSAEPFPQWMGDTAHERVTAWARKNGVPVFDTRAVLPADATLAELYFQRDFHFNAAGSRIVGDGLGERLAQLCQGN